MEKKSTIYRLKCEWLQVQSCLMKTINASPKYELTKLERFNACMIRLINSFHIWNCLP